MLDTHALIWAITDDARLSQMARKAISDTGNEVDVSAVSAFEITTKHRLRKLPEAAALANAFLETIRAADYRPLPITIEHASLAGRLDIPHKDPFDRLLIAQARIEQVPLVSIEAVFDGFGVERLW